MYIVFITDTSQRICFADNCVNHWDFGHLKVLDQLQKDLFLRCNVSLIDSNLVFHNTP